MPDENGETIPQSAILNSTSTNPSFVPGAIEMSGNTVDIESGGLVIAPGGTVSVNGTPGSETTPNPVAYPPTVNKIVNAETHTQARIYMAPDSTIDVSGLDGVTLPVSANLVSFEPFAAFVVAAAAAGFLGAGCVDAGTVEPEAVGFVGVGAGFALLASTSATPAICGGMGFVSPGFASAGFASAGAASAFGAAVSAGLSVAPAAAVASPALSVFVASAFEGGDSLAFTGAWAPPQPAMRAAPPTAARVSAMDFRFSMVGWFLEDAIAR